MVIRKLLSDGIMDLVNKVFCSGLLFEGTMFLSKPMLTYLDATL